MLGNLIGGICSVWVFIAHCLLHVIICSLAVIEALIPLPLHGTKIAKYIKNQSSPDRLPIVLAQFLFST